MNRMSLVGFPKSVALTRLEGLKVVIKETETPMKFQLEKRVHAEEFIVREKVYGQFIELTVSKFL